MAWTPDGTQGNEAGKIKYEIVQYTRGRGLDLGCGPNKAFPHFIGVDNGVDTELFGIQIQPDLRLRTCEKLDMFADGSMDFVFSSHLLEHIVDYKAALKEWWRVITDGGHLVLYLPHKALYPNIGKPGANPDHKHDFVPEDILNALRMEVGFDFGRMGFQVLVNEVRDEGNEYSFLLVVKKCKGERTISAPPPRPPKTACVVRYGGFGDQLQAANILPELKRQGYHVTFMTTPKGQDILKHDPHIDAFFVQDNDQVPNHELGQFWRVQARRFDKFINLSESVEGMLLAQPGRMQHTWPDSMRRKHLNKNYLEFTADIAEVPYKSESRFYASPEETAWAHTFMNGLNKNVFERSFPIVWALSGSSIHKATPHADAVIARIMLEMPEAHVILTGDEACQILEFGWEAEPRVHLRSGKLTIRESITLAQEAALVVGPETGVLNAVAFEEVPKVIFMSHSSTENLTKHWVNTVSLIPPRTPCYPCHRLHLTSEFCHLEPETHAAMCQYNIKPEQAFEPIFAAYRAWKTRQLVAA